MWALMMVDQKVDKKARKLVKVLVALKVGYSEYWMVDEKVAMTVEMLA